MPVSAFNNCCESNSNPTFSLPQNYLYETNASILKGGAFNSICNKYNLNKLALNSHLYTSETLIENFPGRAFKILTTTPYSAKDFKQLKLNKANVSCRNFKDTVEQVKKKLKIKDGGKHYLFATTNHNNKPILVIGVKL